MTSSVKFKCDIETAQNGLELNIEHQHLYLDLQMSLVRGTSNKRGIDWLLSLKHHQIHLDWSACFMDTTVPNANDNPT